MDHFSGFDRLLRVCLHRTLPLHLIGPVGFSDRVDHKLKAYTLNLLDEHSCDFVITASEFNGEGFGTLLDEDEFYVAGVVLDHGTPCLAFAFEDKIRAIVRSERLKSLGLVVGPWLNEAKRAVRRGEPDNSEIVIGHDLSLALAVLKQHALRTARGQKIAYVVDAAYHDQN